MPWKDVWQLILRLISHLGNAADWKASKDGKKIGPVDSVSFGSTDIKVEVEDDGKKLTLEARPGSPDHADVYLNGELQNDARLVVAIKSQPPYKPVIVVLIFKHVRADGGLHDYRFDNPK